MKASLSRPTSMPDASRQINTDCGLSKSPVTGISIQPLTCRALPSAMYRSRARVRVSQSVTFPSPRFWSRQASTASIWLNPSADPIGSRYTPMAPYRIPEEAADVRLYTVPSE